MVATYLIKVPNNWLNMQAIHSLCFSEKLSGNDVSGSELLPDDGVAGARYFRCYSSSGSYIDRMSRTVNSFETLWVFADGGLHLLGSHFELTADDVKGAMKTRAINIHKRAIEAHLGIVPRERFLVINTGSGRPWFRYITDIQTKTGKPASMARKGYLRWVKITPENEKKVELLLGCFETLAKQYWGAYEELLKVMKK